MGAGREPQGEIKVCRESKEPRGSYISTLALWHMAKSSYRLILIRTLYLEEAPEYDFQKP